MHVQAHEKIEMGDFVSGFQDSKTARSLAHSAFFDPKMVGMLYFPNEHKIAIYTPLFIPFSIPLIMRLFKEIGRIRQKAKRKAPVPKNSESDKEKSD